MRIFAAVILTAYENITFFLLVNSADYFEVHYRNIVRYSAIYPRRQKAEDERPIKMSV